MLNESDMQAVCVARFNKAADVLREIVADPEHLNRDSKSYKEAYSEMVDAIAMSFDVKIAIARVRREAREYS